MRWSCLWTTTPSGRLTPLLWLARRWWTPEVSGVTPLRRDSGMRAPIVKRALTQAARRLPTGMKAKLRGSVPPSLQHSVRRILNRKTTNHGLLSVVVPMYNVEEYLAECLVSVVSQSYPYLEIILVDDGCTDGSVRIAREFAKWDKRISIINLPHGGNGRARNVGIAAATGDFLAFADSDDVVAAGAYALMVGTLAGSGSDFLVGSSDRLIRNKRSPTKLSSRLHEMQRLGITASSFPGIIDDVFLWNKVFRRVFWNSCVGPIPEGILYEDQEASARAYLRAKSFDVVRQIVYSWRLRQDGSSITQGKRSFRDLDDRLSVAASVSQLFLAEADDAVGAAWFRRLFGSDLVPYYEQIPYSESSYWDRLQSGVRNLRSILDEAGTVGGVSGLELGPHERLLLAAAAQGDYSSVELILIDRAESGTGYGVELNNGKFLARPGYWHALNSQLRDISMECPPETLSFVSDVRVRGFADDGSVKLSGHAFIAGLDSDHPGLSINLFHGNAQGLEPLILQNIDEPYMDVRSGDAFAEHRQSAFAAELPQGVLDEASGENIALTIELVAGGHRFHRVHTVRRPSRTPTTSNPRVAGFEVDESNGQVKVDVAWGSMDAEAYGVVLSTQQSQILPVRKETIGGSVVRFVFELENQRWGSSLAAPPAGAYTLRYFAINASGDNGPRKPLGVDQDLCRNLPADRLTRYASVTGWETQSGHFAVSIGAPLALDERGKFHQRRLAATFGLPQTQLAAPIVFFESFGGKACTDSPRAISDLLAEQRPDLPLYWSIQDYSVPYPPYATPLVRGTSQWFEVVQTAGTLVNNNNFPSYFRKQPGQRYVQTWHGTPLKKIGLDAPIANLSASYRKLMEREAASWDILLAQNAFAEEVLPKAFGYTGTVLTLGYPRNDALLAPDREERAARIRQLLGIRADQKTVLYAPTWRDDAKSASSGHKLVSHLDFAEARRGLGDDIVFMLRGHHNVTTDSALALQSTVIDVTTYPEINDLILASDMLVTDYSSIMFDYCVTGKPTFFLAPDLDTYQNKTRGFYLDDVGPLADGALFRTEDLVERIRLSMDLDNENPTVTDSLAARFASFDGDVSRKVISQFWDHDSRR
ncbi:bifunctional glycosyltransferase/CDP-glycerol:glycerophosphate glycerophosphotransferase [Pseudarthrobacter sp. P1]|uniref:bifunctional glycosyltransferase/CDP-glycerol:glycerophosphate glycerophosphotransferase n=1 Tax=Pseudarthrobacter sp. P1 TaxID=3418418 RepID=UPI003CE7A2F8